MNYYYLLEDIILEANPRKKIESFKLFYSNFLKGNLKFEAHHRKKKVFPMMS
jgi:hypothetical protein